MAGSEKLVMNANLQAKWRATIDDVQRQLSWLLQQRNWAKRLGEMTRLNKNFARCASPFMRDMSGWYGAYAIMAIRRQADDDPRVVSLRRILEQMKMNAGALVGISRIETLTIDDVVADIQRLEQVSKRIIKVADKEIAHAERGGAGISTTFNELDACVDAYADVARKYVRILTGASMHTLEPVEQFDPSDVFRFPWIPICGRCGHNADYHTDRGCNGGAADYHARIAAGAVPSFTPCSCQATETEAYAQTHVPGPIRPTP